MKPPKYQKHSIWLKDFSPEHLEEAIKGGQFEHYILSPAKCDVTVDHWSLGDFAIDTGRYSFPVRIAGTFPAKKLCFGYMREITDSTWVNGLTTDDHTVEFYPEGPELNYRAAPRGGWTSVTFKETSLQAAAIHHLGHELDLPRHHVTSFRVADVQRSRLDQMIHRFWTCPYAGEQIVRPILGLIAEMLDSHRQRTNNEVSRRCRQREAILQLSDDFLRAHLTDPFDLSALADATGTTRRTLQRTFLDAYGLTPLQWARCHALHRIRERFRSTEARRYSIQGLAEEFGFRHMGRFSQYYRELFGELPSETMLTTAERDGPPQMV